MKSILTALLFLLISCAHNRENKRAEHNATSDQYKTMVNKANLFRLEFKLHENFVSIKAPEKSNFELPDSSAKTEPIKLGDFNADNKGDILVYLGACGTGGCMYGLFLKQYDNYYQLSFLDYLKNVEFKTEKNGLWTIQSSVEVEPYNPSKLQVSIFKWNKNRSYYELDSTYVYIDDEAEK
ncbi:hypothetical protein U0035_06400 [Niabella yanshanensis]|uniref:Lipoprotein n=1 Tax=Niabella yanshanensis TaxID=577386 RepID=A0ABZ0WC54_9BACT|nr:hypothetical protein [Niabella yanshanensis]WQD39776.1 hypothetical protein U0035_06400 [Niabella yanshanensis]